MAHCPYCVEEDFTAPSETLLLTHIRLVHSLDPNFSIQCSYDGCSRTFKSFRTYQNHCLTHRPRAFDEPPATEEYEDLGESDPCLLETESALSVSYIPSQSEMQSHAAKWILKTSEMRNLTRTATVGVVEDVSALVEFVGQALKGQVCHELTSAGVDSVAISRVEEIFKGFIVKPFEGLTSLHQQLQYYRSHFNFIVSTYELRVYHVKI